MAVAFLAAAARFDGLAAGLGEDPVCLFFAFLLDPVTAVFRDLEAVRPVEAWRDAPLALAMGDLEDFFRVFLDIRLPFVAFRGSIIAVLRQTGIRSVAGRARSAADYAQNYFVMPPARLLDVAFDRRRAGKYLLCHICVWLPADDARISPKLELRGWLANRSFGGVGDLIFALESGGQSWMRVLRWYTNFET